MSFLLQKAFDAYGFFNNLTVCLLFTVMVAVLWHRRKMYLTSLKLPGPLALPFFGCVFSIIGIKTTEDIFNLPIKLTERFGRTIRAWIGPRLVIFVTKPEDLQVVFTDPKCFEKDLTAMNAMRDAIGDGLITAPLTIWKNHRKIINLTFSPKILNSFFETFVDHAEILVKKLEVKSGTGKFDILDYVVVRTIDLIAETAMGARLNTEEKQIVDNLNKCMAIMTKRMAMPWLYPAFIFYRTSLGKSFKKSLGLLDDYTFKMVKERRDELKQKRIQEKLQSVEKENDDFIPKRKPFLELVLEMHEEGKGFTDSELRDEVNTIMTGGSDSTAIIISFACMLLGANPECQDKAYAEVNSIFGDSDRRITLEDLPQLQYVERVLKETLRLFPPLPFLLRYIAEDVQLASTDVPAGSTLIFSNFFTHRDPKVWPNPLKFDPDRFLPEECAKRHPYSYVPFGGGPRNCIGYRYGMMSMKVILSTLIRHYKFKSDMEIGKVRLCLEILLKSVEGHPIEIELRKKIV